MTKKMALIALVAGALFLSGCNQQGKDAVAPKVEAVAQAPLVAPPADNAQAWKLYLVNVAKQHMEGIRSSPFMYYLPSQDAEDFDEQYQRQVDNVGGAVMRGVLPGNMLAFGSPASGRMADLIVEAFQHVPAGSMKDVRVLFIGSSDDLERVRTAVEPSGANVVFHEVK